jgi:hypothetical protein
MSFHMRSINYWGWGWVEHQGPSDGILLMYKLLSALSGGISVSFLQRTTNLKLKENDELYWM